MSKKQQFGLYSTGIGVGTAIISSLTNSLDSDQIIASAILVSAGIALFIFGKYIDKYATEKIKRH